jgi:xanthine/CO dehydrogenase XdhC/CoxF family maturation factor
MGWSATLWQLASSSKASSFGSASITTSTEADERSEGAINTHTHVTDNIVRVGLERGTEPYVGLSVPMAQFAIIVFGMVLL